ncbi:MAG: response regulator [Hydrogenophaga sp.]|uniref:hybrid sensor histidine kinase/response regulator n=1 Tax=Hydrogenophaga sp. TaxID=1904254 RepID=UPI0016A276DD|nr:Hpt domain-containing protein [Hydrogenophaga sp.]NIM43172.1 response regulator [Hydrogenophaga sp.]NIN28240.1 response regulator [Hydrogenophaga sp.]NIN30678.1 response regulator [Hydrogenophaga sp.]NIN57375.1 response regulator [Hydrogenophaga sp.]NIO51594.1 response regulator [Hydrogenophaga sp.]
MTEAPETALQDLPNTDLGPLAWVFEELRKSLDAANKAIRRFVRENEQSRHGDLEAVDPAALRMARQQLHQAVGALEVVGLGAPAQVLRGMESAVQRFVQKPESCDEQAAARVERASFALIEYLEAVLNHKAVQPVALFHQYREVLELAGAERVHPADLWDFDHRGIDVPAPPNAKALEVSAAVRSLFDRLTLLVVKTQSAAACQQLAKLCGGLSAAMDEPRQRTFWRVAAAFFESAGSQGLPFDIYVKRAASRLLMQFGQLASRTGQVSETLLHDLLFFCAQSQVPAGVTTQHLEAVREAYGLHRYRPADYHQATLGRYDPAVLAQARKRIQAAKEAWSLFSGGDNSRARQVGDQFGLIGESLLKLHAPSAPLSAALVKATDRAVNEPGGVRPELAMEVATTTLYLEAAFEDFDPGDPQLAVRTQELAQRLTDVIEGKPARPLDDWMEQLYRRISDRQTMGSVVDELKVSLGEVEKSLDQFFRQPQEKAGLHVAVTQLAQMRGVLSVLGLDHAVQAVTRMRSSVEQILDTEVDEALAREAGTFQQLGDNLSALSFLVDMLSYQPSLAKKLFVFDEDKGGLVPLMGRASVGRDRSQPARDDAEALQQGVRRVVDSVFGGLDDLSGLSQQLDSLADQAALAEQPAVAKAAREAAEAVVRDDAMVGAQALVGLTEVAVAEAPTAAAVEAPADDGTDEDDLLDIFLEEAREVVANGREAVSHLREQPSDLDHLTTLRRAFHTLKGSSRMVGLNEFGEAAWAMEQLLNAVLAEQRPANEPLLGLSGESLDQFERWVRDIAAQQAGAWRSQPFRASAEALRVQGVWLPLQAPEALEVEAIDVSLDEPVDAAPADDAAGPSTGLGDLPMPEPLSDTALDVPLLADIDLDLLAQTAQPASVEAPAEPVEQSAAHADPVEPLAVAAVPPEFDELEDFPREAVESGFAEIEQIELTAPAPLPVAAPALPADVPPEEPMREIGPLRIGHKLYNVFLNEADEWSRRLNTGLSEWALETHAPVPESAEALAHSLAGSSGTVGFESLSGIARALEHALGSVAARQRAGHEASAALGQLFVDAGEDVRRLLHQFAAGFLKEANPELLASLVRVVHDPLAFSEPPAVAPVSDLDDVFLTVTDEIELLPADDEPALTAAAGAPVVTEEVMPTPEAAPVDWEPPVAAEPVRAESPGNVHQDIDDDIDAVDTIDIDLFPIFEEEAQELLPQMGAALRQWSARPDDGAARGEVLRALHTLKGSARLAGALRLGEMAHRMETAAERLGSDVQRASDLEVLQSAFDAIAARFEALRHPDAQTGAVQQSAPEVQVAEPSENADAAQAPTGAAPAINTVALGANFVAPIAPAQLAARSTAAVRVRPELLDRLVNQTGEVIISRSRMEAEVVTLRTSLKDLTGNLDRLRQQLRDIELQAETQMQSRLAQARDHVQSFDPLEFDRFTRVQELTRMMAESVNDVATLQRNLQRAVEATEDNLVAQARQTRELQRDLLRTRMVEFEGIAERLYRVVRQASKETGKQVRLDITGGNIEMDRGVLDRMTGTFEHLLRNHVAHGIEAPELRGQRGKPAEGRIDIQLHQERNDVSLVFADDGGGIDLDRLREKAREAGLLAPGVELDDEQAAQLIFEAGISTAREVSELAGRGIGMDVVRSDVLALGGRIETSTRAGQGTSFKLVLPLTTAVTQVVMLRAGELMFGVPSNVVEIVRRVPPAELQAAYASGHIRHGDEDVPFFWSGALLQSSAQSQEPQNRTLPVVIFRSAAQRVALHIDEVLGNQEVVVKNLGAQLSRLPGLAGMSVLASGAVALIYNPVALASVYGPQVPEWVQKQLSQPQPADATAMGGDAGADTALASVPLVLVVDDSITVRRVTQRLLQREGYRVVLAADGLQALERLQVERPAVVLSDIEMPRMDGFDLVRNIRADARLADLPVIMITSRIAEKHREHARELGVDHYLGKPYSEDELLVLVARYARSTTDA